MITGRHHSAPAGDDVTGARMACLRHRSATRVELYQEMLVDR
jgi:hypothetical protein